VTELRGERVVLRLVEEADVATLRAIRPSGWSPNDDWPLETSNAARNSVLVDGVVIGFIQSGENTDPEYRHASIDVFLGAPWRGQGLGADAVRTLAVHLVHDLGHHRIVIDPQADNIAAIRCYSKVGFRPVGVMRRYELDHATGEWKDGLLMDLLAEELPPIRPAASTED
jgi:aminoglycoside 6'-N-acetyltransferase